MKNSKINRKPLIYVCLIVTLVIILGYVCIRHIRQLPYILWNDQWFQYNLFYKEWVRLVVDFLHGKGLPLYSWNMYLGTDFYSSMSYYCTGDIFLPLLILFRNNVETGLVIETIICIYISSILMYFYLKKIKINSDNALILIPIVYALAGQSMLFFGNYMFHRFFTFLPLLFIGIENYYQNNRLSLFIIGIAVCFLQNYYMMYPALFGVLFYCATKELKNKNNIKIILKDFVILLFAILIGFMISSFVTLPGMYYILSNPRLTSNSDYGIFWPIQMYFGFLANFISLNPVATIPDMFATAGDAHENYFNLFITIIPFVFALIYIGKKKNRVDLISIIILVICLLFKPLSSILHGFSVPSIRWAFIIEFFLLVYGAKGMDEYPNDNKSLIKITICYSLLVILAMILFGFEGKFKYHIVIIIISVLLCICISFVYKRNKKLAIIISLLEIVFSALFYINLQLDGLVILPEPINKDFLSYYQNIEDKELLYRFYLNYKDNYPSSVLNMNGSLSYNMMTTSTYSTTYDVNIIPFINLSNSIKSVDWDLQCDDPYANTMLGVKYYIAVDRNELPKELDFSDEWNIGYLNIYRNLNYKGFSHTNKNIKYLDELKNTKDFVDYTMIDDRSVEIFDYSELDEKCLQIYDKGNNYLKGNIELSSDNILLVPIPNNKGWKILVDGISVKPISINGGFIGIPLKAGCHNIEMYFVSPLFKVGIILTGIGILTSVFVFVYEKKKNVLIYAKEDVNS